MSVLLRRAVRRSRSEAKLDRTMDVFWERGYYDTSVEELVRRTGLHRAAVYGEFGSKRRLFEASPRRYREKVTAELLEPLARPDAARADLERLVRGRHDAATLLHGPTPHGLTSRGSSGSFTTRRPGPRNVSAASWSTRQ